MVEEIIIDSNLLYLRNILNGLDGFSFDEDIQKILDKLKDRIDYKLYHNSNNLGLDIKHYELIERYYYDNKK